LALEKMLERLAFDMTGRAGDEDPGQGDVSTHTIPRIEIVVCASEIIKESE
jgi:hypothetical protein